MSRARLPLLAFALALAGPALAGEDARTILTEAEARHRTRTQQYAGELTVVSREGKVRRKAWRNFREGYAGDAKGLIRFVDPPEVRGVGFLSVGRPGKSPDQWLYLPSMKRERRIASQDRDASFVGTDFNYEDIEEFDHTAHDVALRGEEILDGQPCFVIEARPKQASLYERKTLWIRKDILYLIRMDAVRRGEKEPAKRLLLGDVGQVDGHFVARKWEMASLKTGSRTTVLLKELAFDRPNPPDRFTLQSLNREGGDD